MGRTRESVKKRNKVITWVVATVVVAAVVLLNFKQRDSYKCPTCHTKRHVFQWRMGLWMLGSLPLSREWEEIQKTNVYKHLMPLGHKHTWVYWGGSPYYFCGTVWGGCRLGIAGNMNMLCLFYEGEVEFREFVQQKIEAGVLTTEDVIEIVALPKGLFDVEQRDPKKSGLIERAEQLLEEYMQQRK